MPPQTFALQVPFILVTFAISLLTIPECLGPCHAYTSEKTSRWQFFKDFDITGSILLAITVALFVLGITLGGNTHPWKHPLVITSLTLPLPLGVALWWVEKRAKRPVMPISLLLKKPQSNLIWNNTFAATAVNVVMFNAPIYFNVVKLESPSESGLRLMGPSIAVTAFGFISGMAIKLWRRVAVLIVAGTVCMLIGGILMSSMWHGIPAGLATFFVAPANVGQGLSWGATQIGVLMSSPQEEQAVITSLLTLGRSLGVVLGVAISSGLLENFLEMYLQSYVTGADKAAVIDKVRKSVQAVHKIPRKQQAEVIVAYEQSLRVTFLSSVIISFVAIWLLWPVRLPKVGEDEKAAINVFGAAE